MAKMQAKPAKSRNMKNKCLISHTAIVIITKSTTLFISSILKQSLGFLGDKKVDRCPCMWLMLFCFLIVYFLVHFMVFSNMSFSWTPATWGQRGDPILPSSKWQRGWDLPFLSVVSLSSIRCIQDMVKISHL